MSTDKQKRKHERPIFVLKNGKLECDDPVMMARVEAMERLAAQERGRMFTEGYGVQDLPEKVLEGRQRRLGGYDEFDRLLRAYIQKFNALSTIGHSREHGTQGEWTIERDVSNGPGGICAKGTFALPTQWVREHYDVGKIRRLDVNSTYVENNGESNNEDEHFIHEEVDPAELQPSGSKEEQKEVQPSIFLVMYICYSIVWDMPVAYFDFVNSSGTSVYSYRLGLKHIPIPTESEADDDDEPSKDRVVITQEECPASASKELLWHIHSCDTAYHLDILASYSLYCKGKDNLILSWVSLVEVWLRLPSGII